jgi:hypothetical protein
MRRSLAPLALLLGAAGTSAQPLRSLLQQSNARARVILARAIDTHSGLDALKGMRTLWLDESGQVWMRTQGPLPGRRLTPRRVRNVMRFDFVNGRGCEAPDAFAQRHHTNRKHVLRLAPRTVVRDGAVTTMSMWMRRDRSRAPAGWR